VAGVLRKGQVGTLIVTACRDRSQQMSIYLRPLPDECLPMDEVVAIEAQVEPLTEDQRAMTADGPGFTLKNARVLGLVSRAELCKRSQ